MNVERFSHETSTMHGFCMCSARVWAVSQAVSTEAIDYSEGAQMIIAKRPRECSSAELQDFAAFVLAGREVSPDGLEGRINKAEMLLFLVHDGCLKGIAAVKNPEKSHRERVFRKAQATVEAKRYPFELGWVFVLPSSRGCGLSHKLVQSAISCICGDITESCGWRG
jgi:hypothetical protein